MRSVGAFLFMLLMATPLACADESGFGRLTVKEVQARLQQKNVYVFDNNNKKVFRAGHVPGAKWLDPSDYAATELPADKSATLIFYCHNEL